MPSPPTRALSLYTNASAEALKFFNAAKLAEGDLVWVKARHKEGDEDSPKVWDLGEVIAALAKSTDETCVIRTLSGDDVVTRRAFPAEKIELKGKSPKKVGYNDMTAMKFVNEPQILHNLEARSYSDLPYTFLGPVLVAVNPLKAMDFGLKPGTKEVLSQTHPFAVAELAYQQMLFALKHQGETADSPTNQTIVVSGESGAGKTVSSKMSLEHLVARTPSKCDDTGTTEGGKDLAKAMLGSNPILEGFGNSCTLRNPNSSRFGKIFKICYTKDGSSIFGAQVGTYLLERSRITTHELGERNYHVFYQLLASQDNALLSNLDLDPSTIYRILVPRDDESMKTSTDAFLKSDHPNFVEMQEAFQFMGVSDVTRDQIYALLAAVLHLGNVSFDALTVEGNDASAVSEATRHHLNSAAKLLGVDASELELVFIQLERKVGATKIKSTLSADHAAQLLDAALKSLYSRLFTYIVATVNGAINDSVGGLEDAVSIGVLDIFGFETFVKNDLEQLLINFTNEALQLVFNRQVLEAEAALYRREALAMSEQDKMALDPEQVVDKSNKLCIDLLQGVDTIGTGKGKSKKKTHLAGVLDIIHEQGRVPSPTEKKMLEKMHKLFGAKNIYPNYHFIRKEARSTFIIQHYAGKVKYTTGSFLLKNNDTLPKACDELFFSSTNETTKAVWDSSAGPKKKKNSKKSIVSEFKVQIQTLMSDLDSTSCSFIRCIKPNATMHRNEGWFDARYVTAQLRNLAVPKTADVLKAGLPTRLPYVDLLHIYAELFADEPRVKVPDAEDDGQVKAFVAGLFYAFEVPRTAYKLGLTKVFFKSGDLDKLEEVLASAESWDENPAIKERIVTRIGFYRMQRLWKGVFAYLYAGRQFIMLHETLKKSKQLQFFSARMIQMTFRQFIAKKELAKLRHAKKLEEQRLAQERAEQERKERERLAEEARQQELEKQRQIQVFLEQKREAARKEKEKYAKMHAEFIKANQAAADFKRQELELRKQEKLRRDAEEEKKREEAAKQRQELEALKLKREQEEKLEEEAREKERQAKAEYEAKLALARQAEAKKASDEKEAEEKRVEASEAARKRLEEKRVLENVVDICAQDSVSEDHEAEDGESDADSNPWFYYEDLDLDNIDRISHDSDDDERIVEALRFLDTLGDDSDSGSDSGFDSDLETLNDGISLNGINSQQEQYREELERRGDSVGMGLGRTTGSVPLQRQEYAGPFVVEVNMLKLENKSGKPKGLSAFQNEKKSWKQCFAFVYPTHEKVLLHQGVDNTIKLEFNSIDSKEVQPAVLKSSTMSKNRKNVLSILGVRRADQDASNESRELVMSFQYPKKREEFAALLKPFVLSEDAAPKNAGFKKNTRTFAPPKSKFGSKPKFGAKTKQRRPSTGADASRLKHKPPPKKIGGVKGLVGMWQTKAAPPTKIAKKEKIRAGKYHQYAAIKKAEKNGKIGLNNERLQSLLMQDDNDYEDDVAPVSRLLQCKKCHKAMLPRDAKCPHCGTLAGRK